MRRSPVPGDVMLHPVAIAAVGVLLINDHALKAIAPGALTGKLSDVAGLAFFPLLLVSGYEVLASFVGRWRGPHPAATWLAVLATGVAFAAVKALPQGEAAYETLLGTIQWPFRAVAAFGSGLAPRSPAIVEIVRDPTDLVALVALGVALAVGLRRARTPPGVRRLAQWPA